MIFEEIYEKFRTSALVYAIQKCREYKFDCIQERAEEFVQEAFLKMLESNYIDEGKAYAWLCKVIDNLVIDTYRAEKC